MSLHPWLAIALVAPLLSPQVALAEPLLSPQVALAEPLLSPQVALAEPLTLEQLLTFADEHAPRLRVAREARAAARAERAAASPVVPENPNLELSGGPRLSSEGVGFAFEASLTQALYVSGERATRLRAADAALVHAEARIEAERWALHVDLHQRFDAALLARRRVALLGEVEGFQARLAEIAAKKARAGEIAALEVRLSEIELAEARQHLLAARTEYRLACMAIATLVGWEPGRPVEPAEVELKGSAPPPLEALLARALELEPGRRQRQAEVAWAKARLSAERRAASLTPTVGLGLGHEGGVGAEPSVTTVQAIVSVPLPFAQRNQGAIAHAQSALGLAEVERDAHEQWLVARVHELHAALLGAAERQAVFADAILPRLTESLTLLERAFAVGELDLTATILARERFVKARLDALAALADHSTARAELERLLGSDVPEVTP